MIYFGLKPIAKFLRSNNKRLGFAGGMAQVIKSLFANNEQGFAFDFNDLSTMYQDAAGTIPVTDVGQPVGLVLDKSKGLMLGKEYWIDANTTIVGQSQILGGGKYRIYSPDGAQSYISVSSGLEPNKMYEAIFTIESLSGTISVVGSPDVPFSTTGKKRCVFTPLNTNLAIKRGTTCDAVISSVSVRELSGNHAFQSTSAKRPILQQNATTGAYYLSFDGVDDYLVTGTTTAMGLGTTVFGANKCTKSDFAALVSKGYNGYIYNTTSQVVIQNSAGVTALNTTYPEVFTAIYNPNGIDTTIRANGLSKSSANNARGYNNTNPLIIGAFNTDSVYAYKGDIYTLIGINRMATTDEITNTEQTLAKLIGVML